MKLLFYYFLVLLAHAPLSSVAQDRAAGRLAYDVSAAMSRRANDELVLEFTIHNRAEITIEVPESRLPWNSDGTVYNIVVFAKEDREQTLKRFYSPDGPNGLRRGMRVLKAGEQLSGELAMTAICPDLKKASKSGDAVVYWAYRLGYRELGANGNAIPARKLCAGAVVVGR